MLLVLELYAATQHQRMSINTIGTTMFRRLIKALWIGFQIALGTAIGVTYSLPTWLVIKAYEILCYIFSDQFRRILVKTSTYILYIIMSCILVVIAYGYVRTTVDSFKQAQVQRKAELECVAKMIASGHERIDIRTFNGTCEVTPNGYYK